MKVDAAFAWSWFFPVEYVGRLHHQMYRCRPHLFEAPQIEEGGVSFAVRRFNGYIVLLTVDTAREIATAPLKRTDDVRECK
jgi:hypothetical protein